MNRLSFDTFFETATGNSPYDYQSRLAGADAGQSCKSQLVSIPTGLGKTAAVILAWLWNRVAHPDAAHRTKWPRRLVYCLPMRTLVEQTADEVKTWIANILADRNGKLALDAETKSKLEWLRDNSPAILMGGEDAGEWDIYPEGNFRAHAGAAPLKQPDRNRVVFRNGLFPRPRGRGPVEAGKKDLRQARDRYFRAHAGAAPLKQRATVGMGLVEWLDFRAHALVRPNWYLGRITLDVFWLQVFERDQ